MRIPYEPPKKKHWRDDFTWPVIVSTLVSIISILIAIFGLRTTQRAFETDQRAWLKADYGLPQYFTAANFVVQVQIKNVGKSVALHGIAYTKVEIADSEKGPTFKLPFPYQANLPAIFPTDTQVFPATRTPSNPDGSRLPLTVAQVQDLMNGKSYIAIFGQVVYSDQFGQHFTRYCTWGPLRGQPVIINDRFNIDPCIKCEEVGHGPPPMKFPG